MQDNPTIMHLVLSLETGGLERFVVDLISANSSEFDQFIVCLERTGEQAQKCNSEVVSLNVGSGIRLGAVYQLAEIIRSRKVTLIHTHNEKALFYGALAGLLATVPVVHTKHGKNRVTAKSFLRTNIVSRFCRKVVAVSKDAAAQSIREEKIAESKVMTILNGIDVNRYVSIKGMSSVKASFGIHGPIPVIGIVARLATVKDHATLFAACRILKAAVKDFRLLVVGDGPLMEDLVGLADVLGLQKEILFTGPRSDIPEIMNALDIFVLSSVSEGISLTLIEAMACEVPVVATDVGGNPEVVVPGETGFLVPVRDPVSMANVILLLLQDPKERARLGRNGRVRAVKHFSLQRACEEYQQLYLTVLKGS